MFNPFKKLWNDKRGNSLIIAAAALPMVLGASGLAVDTIQWALWKRQLQRSADSAAIAGVYDRMNGGSEEGAAAAISKDLDLNFHAHADLVGDPEVEWLDDAGELESQVKVTLQVQRPLSFSGIFMKDPPLIVASATAASVPGSGEFCVVSLEKNGNKTGITVSGNAAIDMDCSFMTNSPSNEAAVAKGSAEVHAVSVSAVGGITKSSNWDIDSYNPYSSALDDPFADVDPSSSEMKCAATATTRGHTTTYSPTALTSASQVGSNTTQSGTTANCWSSLTVASGTTMDLGSDKTIYINGGDIDVRGKLKCERCTFILTNSSTATSGVTIGNIKVNASAEFNVTAPSDETNKYQGIAVYQDRRATDSASANNTVNGNSASIIQGVLYFPSQELTYNGTGTDDAICTMFVTRRIVFSGNNGTTNKFKKGSECGAYGLPTVEGEESQRVRLVA